MDIHIYIYYIYYYTWNSKQPVFYGCFNWMIPNHYIKNGCFTNHPLKKCCLGYLVYIEFNPPPCNVCNSIHKYYTYIYIYINWLTDSSHLIGKNPNTNRKIPEFSKLKQPTGGVPRFHHRSHVALNEKKMCRLDSWKWYIWMFPKIVGTPKWMVYNGKPYENGWFGGTTIFGNIHLARYTPEI